MNRQNNFQASVPNYDPHIIPAESAARQQRECKQCRHTPHDQADRKSIRTSDG